MARKTRTPEQIKQYQADWRKRNRVKMRKYAKKYRDAHRDAPAHLERKYGITIADKEKMYADQKSLCAVCGEPMADVFDRNCQVDHDHVSEKVRGLVHWYCNILVGVVRIIQHCWKRYMHILIFTIRDAIVRSYRNENCMKLAEMSSFVRVSGNNIVEEIS